MDGNGARIGRKYIFLFGFYQIFRNFLFGFCKKIENYLFGKNKICTFAPIKSSDYEFIYSLLSLWEFMREKNLTFAIRCSLENFSSFDYTDMRSEAATRHVLICPLYAVSRLQTLMTGMDVRDRGI